MKRLFAPLLLSMAIAWPAKAESFIERLGRTIDQVGKDLQQELETRVLRGNRAAGDATRLRQGVCLAVRGGEVLFRNKCTAEKSCNGPQDCKIAYRWPPRDLMEARWGEGKPLTFIGAAAKQVAYEGQPCLSIRNGTTIFCFIDDDRAVAPLLPAPSLPGGNDVAEAPETRVSDTPEKDESAQKAEPDEDGSLRHQAERERTQADHDAERKSQAAEQTRREAEANLIAELTDDADIDWFFKDKTLATLAPVDAVRACRDFFLSRIIAVARQAPADAVEAMHDRCGRKAESYGWRIVKQEAARLADPFLKAPATLQGLQQHNWFKLNPSNRDAFTPLQQTRLGIEFDHAVRTHRDNAVNDAVETIRKVYKSAAPLTESADAALALCNLNGSPPEVLIQTCKQLRESLRERIKTARCRRAIDQSGATRGMLDMAVEASGSRYETWALRRVICVGVGNHPDYRITVGNGLIPWLTAPSLQVFNGNSNKLLDVELRVSTPRDGRSFGQLLLDIATGENEREVPEKLVVEKVRFAARGITWRDDSAIIGCVLGFIKCQ
ncbi:hypothetical protein GN330_18780 [Nitratireductor sp. CAU 1489]|uniref:Uncharacterized protein n=1 Tax=Nitratireductor arenosus TaxID=2682096 RepID=A0A844QL38_9HYPH|nr:hypothetical protein [Nitratireductor arenosus]MVA99294.1 hypothetical protein [Nitratireductor arenosus]